MARILAGLLLALLIQPAPEFCYWQINFANDPEDQTAIRARGITKVSDALRQALLELSREQGWHFPSAEFKHGDPARWDKAQQAVDLDRREAQLRGLPPLADDDED
jgi:hypothetical protein